MKHFAVAVSVAVLCSAVVAGAAQRGRGAEPRSEGVGPAVQADVRVVFSTGDLTVIREHYGPRYRNLPPGLQKKLARTGQLPPGWQKKMEPFPVNLERRLRRLPAGHQRGVIDGHAVIYLPGTGVMVDAAVLF
jgi:hypothetical protein